ncbi:MAG: hypothetical protein V3R81_05755, partial [Gammaproteobacteria bacterium]
KAIDASAQDAIEQTISAMTLFDTPATSTVSTSMGNVTVLEPDCIDSQVATGYSAVVGDIIPEDNTWEIVAEITDPVTGAKTTLHQGVEIRMLAGNCPD